MGLLLGNGEMGGLARNDGLGFDELWFSDYWSDRSRRAPIPGFRLELKGVKGCPAGAYCQHLSLREGVLTTGAGAGSGAYRTTVFFSQVDRHLLRLRLENTSASKQAWTILLPRDPVRMSRTSDSVSLVFEAKSDYMALPFTRATWTMRSSLRLKGAGAGAVTVDLKAGERLDLAVAITTSFDGPEAHAEALKAAAQGFDRARSRHEVAWRTLWERFDVELPRSDYAGVFYRSLYYSFCVTGSGRFLPGECQFSEPAWGMQPFTSGTPTWGAILMASLNHEERARDLLDKLYTPQTLRENASMYLKLLSGRYLSDDWGVPPYSFAHQIDIAGRESCFPFGIQRHIDGLMPATFHNVSCRFDATFSAGTPTYDVLRGCAVFWLGMLEWDRANRTCAILPTLGLDEMVVKSSTLASVIACAWTLMMFARYAKEAGRDARLAAECRRAYRGLAWPQNAQRYLDFPGDPEKGAGYNEVSNAYNCVRSFMTFCFPYTEMAGVLDRAKALRTLDAIHRRNRFGEGDAEHQRARRRVPGFNTMTANWYALTEAHLGRGDTAYDLTNLAVLHRLDPSGVAMSEAYNYRFFYFATGYMTFALTVLSMLLQSRDGVIRPFPALPGAFRTVRFRNLTAERGILVSGSMTNGKVDFVRYEKDGKELATTRHACPIKIHMRKGRWNLTRGDLA